MFVVLWLWVFLLRALSRLCFFGCGWNNGPRAQVLTVLLKHRCGATTSFVNEAGVELFQKMVRHLGNFSVMQVAKLLLLPKYAALQGKNVRRVCRAQSARLFRPSIAAVSSGRVCGPACVLSCCPNPV